MIVREAHRTADEFTCTEYGREIVSFPARDPPPTVCMMCTFLAGILADPAERDEVRRRLVLGSSGVQTLGRAGGVMADPDMIVAAGDGIVDVLADLTRRGRTRC